MLVLQIALYRQIRAVLLRFDLHGLGAAQGPGACPPREDRPQDRSVLRALLEDNPQVAF